MASVTSSYSSDQSSSLAATLAAPRSATLSPALRSGRRPKSLKLLYPCMLSELESTPAKACYYSDSISVPGYIANCDRCYAKYAARRDHMTLSHTSISDWFYSNTHENPADFSSRLTPPDVLTQSCWCTGPSFLWNVDDRPVSFDMSLTQDIFTE